MIVKNATNEHQLRTSSAPVEHQLTFLAPDHPPRPRPQQKCANSLTMMIWRDRGYVFIEMSPALRFCARYSNIFGCPVLVKIPEASKSTRRPKRSSMDHEKSRFFKSVLNLHQDRYIVAPYHFFSSVALRTAEIPNFFDFSAGEVLLFGDAFIYKKK